MGALDDEVHARVIPTSVQRKMADKKLLFSGISEKEEKIHLEGAAQ